MTDDVFTRRTVSRQLLELSTRIENVDAYSEPMLADRYEPVVRRLHRLADEQQGDGARSALREGVFDLNAVAGGIEALERALARLREAERFDGGGLFEIGWSIGAALLRLGRAQESVEQLEGMRSGDAGPRPKILLFTLFEAYRRLGLADACTVTIDEMAQGEAEGSSIGRDRLWHRGFAGRRVRVLLLAGGPGDAVRHLMALTPVLAEAGSVELIAHRRLWPMLQQIAPTAALRDHADPADPTPIVSGYQALEQCVRPLALEAAAAAGRLRASPEVRLAEQTVRAAIPELAEGACLFQWRTNKMSRRRMAKCATVQDFAGIMAIPDHPLVCVQHSLSPRERAFIAARHPKVVIAEDRLDIFTDPLVLYALTASAAALVGPHMTATEYASVAGTPIFAINVDEDWRRRSDGGDCYYASVRHHSRPHATPAGPSVAATLPELRRCLEAYAPGGGGVG